jgi:hypothetical protein
LAAAQKHEGAQNVNQAFGKYGGIESIAETRIVPLLYSTLSDGNYRGVGYENLRCIDSSAISVSKWSVLWAIGPSQ